MMAPVTTTLIDHTPFRITLQSVNSKPSSPHRWQADIWIRTMKRLAPLVQGSTVAPTRLSPRWERTI